MQAIATDSTGILPLVAVAILCGAAALLGWLPLSLPSRVIHDIVDVGNCTSKQPGTRDMYLCSARVGAMTMAGPIVTIGVLFLLRAPITRGAQRLTDRTPANARFLVAPAVATLLFTIPWAGAHYKTSGQSGILPQTVFPAVVGLFTFAVTRWGPALQRRLLRFFDARDRVPGLLRLMAATVLPALVALVITNEDRVSDSAMKEQFVVLLALLTGYLALAPRSGTLAGGARALLGRRPPTTSP